MPVHASTQCIFIDPRNLITVSSIWPQEPIEDDAFPLSCGPLFPEDPSGGGELRPRSFTGLPILLLMDAWQPVFPDEDGTKGGNVCSFVPQFPEENPVGGGNRAPQLPTEKDGGEGEPEDDARAPRFEPDENPTGGGSYIPEDPAGGGDLRPQQCGPDEPPIGGGSDVPYSNCDLESPGGGASDVSTPDGGGGTTGGDMPIFVLGGDGLMPEEPGGKGSRGLVFFPTEPAGSEDEPSLDAEDTSDEVDSSQPAEEQDTEERADFNSGLPIIGQV